MHGQVARAVLARAVLAQILDVTAWLRPGETQRLTVEVTAAAYGMDPAEDVWKRTERSEVLMPWSALRDNACGNGCFTPRGIWRDVRLNCLPPVHISRPSLHTVRIDGEGAHLHLCMEVCDETAADVIAGFPWSRVRRRHSNFVRNTGGTAATLEELQVRACRYGKRLEITVTNTGSVAASPVYIALQGVSAWYGGGRQLSAGSR